MMMREDVQFYSCLLCVLFPSPRLNHSDRFIFLIVMFLVEVVDIKSALEIREIRLLTNIQ